MPTDRPRHRGGARRRPSTARERWVIIGVAVTSAAILSVLALVYWQPGWTADAAGSPKLVGIHRVAKPTPETTEPTSVAEVTARAPLTGLPSDSDLGHPAVTVKVSNTPDAHPHRGLGAADIVFVEPITGATTRLAAIFHSTLPAEVGPVRSLRPMDAPLTGPTHGVLANTMAQQWVLDYLDAEADVANLGTMRVPSGTYRIDNARYSPNHVFAQPSVLLDAAERTEPPPAYFTYATDPSGSTPQTGGSPASAVTIGYGDPSTATWRYDEDSGRWLGLASK